MTPILNFYYYFFKILLSLEYFFILKKINPTRGAMKTTYLMGAVRKKIFFYFLFRCFRQSI